MRIPFLKPEKTADYRQPAPTPLPSLSTLRLAAQYRAARLGGDFYDFSVVGSKLVFIMLDIAGKRESAMGIATSAQEMFRQRAAELLGDGVLNDTEAMTTLILELNRHIMAAARGVRCAPAFLGCYDEQINTLTYINAGHMPAVLKDEDGTLLLEANGLPLGLFSHSTHDSQYCALSDSAVLVLVSKGLVEARGGSGEFGIERVREVIAGQEFGSAEAVCAAIHGAVEKHEHGASHFGPNFPIPGFSQQEPNDVTAIALKRMAAQNLVARAR